MGVKIIADWIPHMEAYRLYDPQYPQQAIAYVDDPKEAEDRGYEVIINESESRPTILEAEE